MIANPFSKQARNYNIVKYNGRPPDRELILKTVKRSGLKSKVIFEAVWGMPRGTITLSINNYRDMPIRYWHIFYEYDVVYQLYKNQKKKKISNKNVTPLITNKQLVDGFRN